MCTPYLWCSTTRTYPGACIAMKCAHPFFDNDSRTLLRCTQNQNLVLMTHQPICTFTFTIGTNDSPTYMYNYKGFHIRDITNTNMWRAPLTSRNVFPKLKLFGKIWFWVIAWFMNSKYPFSCSFIKQPHDSLESLILLSCFPLDYLSNGFTPTLFLFFSWNLWPYEINSFTLFSLVFH
jgi:hypothetical protein